MSRTRGHDAIVAGSEGTEQMTTENINLPSSHVAPNAESSASDVARFAQVLRAHAPYDGRFELRVPGVYAIRASRTNSPPLDARAHYTSSRAMRRDVRGAVASDAGRILLDLAYEDGDLRGAQRLAAGGAEGDAADEARAHEPRGVGGEGVEKVPAGPRRRAGRCSIQSIGRSSCGRPSGKWSRITSAARYPATSFVSDATGLREAPRRPPRARPPRRLCRPGSNSTDPSP